MLITRLASDDDVICFGLSQQMHERRDGIPRRDREGGVSRAEDAMKRREGRERVYERWSTRVAM